MMRIARRRAAARLLLMAMVFGALAVPLALFRAASHAAAQPARPAFVVNSTADAPDADLNDDMCATTAGTCTLRAAVQQANASDGADAIVMPGGDYTLAIAGADEQAARGDLDITDDLTISGVPTATVTIDAAQLDRIFDIYTATVMLDNLIMRNGQTNADGGTIYNRGTLIMNDSYIAGSETTTFGGGIFNAATGTVTAKNVTFESLHAGSGGAIWNAGTLHVSDSSFSDNVAQSSGGAITNDHALVITHSLLTRNRAAAGGAIYQGSGTLAVQSSTLDGNTAVYGGGVSIDPDASVEIEASTISSNTAAQGGGIFNLGMLALRNSTLSGNSASNSATDQLGGGIFNGGSTTANSVTMVNNAAPAGSAVRSSGAITFTNSIVAQSEQSAGGENCSGAVKSAGYNLDSGDTCGFNATGDLRAANPMLGELALNGASIQTHALLPGSPAIDSGTPSGCPATDARGVARPQGAGCDMGAFEREQTNTATPTTATPQPGTPTTTATVTATTTPQPGTPTTTAQPAPDRSRVLLPLITK